MVLSLEIELVLVLYNYLGKKKGNLPKSKLEAQHCGQTIIGVHTF